MWDAVNRRDLRHSISVVVPFSVQPKLRSDPIAPEFGYDLLFGDDYEGIRQQFADSVADLVMECFLELPMLHGVTADPRPYHIGPNAQSFPMWLVNLYQDARPFLNDSATLLALGTAAKALIARIPKLLEDKQLEVSPNTSDPSRLPIAFSETILAGICISHLIETYDPKGLAKFESYCRRPFHEFGDADHPGGDESYTFTISVGENLYVYDIDNHARVANHFVISHGRVRLLALPVFDHEFSMPIPDSEPVRRMSLAFGTEPNANDKI